MRIRDIMSTNVVAVDEKTSYPRCQKDNGCPQDQKAAGHEKG